MKESEIKKLIKERDELAIMVKKLKVMSMINASLINKYETMLKGSGYDNKYTRLKAESYMGNT